jgi:hypothetical protein
MSTRQLRLQTDELIRKRLKDLYGKRINVVLRNNTVILGDLIKTDDLSATVKNLRLKKISIPFTDINEVYFDTKE